MDAGHQAPRLRPLDLGQTLDVAIKLVRSRAASFMLAVLVVVVPIEVLSVFITTSTTVEYDVAGEAVYDDEGAYVAGQAAIALLGGAGALLSTAACLKLVAEGYLGRPASAAASLAFAARRGPALVALTLVTFVGLAFAFVALIVPGIWLAVAWSLAYPALLVERLGVIGSLRRSFRLVKGHWWRTCGVLLVAYILMTVVTLALIAVAVGLIAVFMDGSSFGATLLEAAVNVLAGLITTPLLAAVIGVVYFDLRVRKEGFDLAVLAEHIGGTPALDPAPQRAFGGLPAPDGPPAPGLGGAPPGWLPPSPGESRTGG